MRGIAVCVLMLTLCLWTMQQGNALPRKQQKTFSSSQFPQYRLLQKTPHFEYRSYEPSTLLSTVVPVNSSINGLFDKLTNLQVVGSAGVVNVDEIFAIHRLPCGLPYYDGYGNAVYSCRVNYQFYNKLICANGRHCSYEGMGLRDTEGYKCVFPFRYKGIWFHACTSYNAKSRKLWCAHRKYYYDGYGEWGYCHAVRQRPSNRWWSTATTYIGDLPELSAAYVLPREMEAEALASSPGNDVTVTPVPAGNICSRELETADMSNEMILATASELVKHCRQAGLNHKKISMVKYLDKEEPRAEMWFM